MKPLGDVAVRLIAAMLSIAAIAVAGCHRSDTVGSSPPPASASSSGVSPPPASATEAPAAADAVPGMRHAEFGEACGDSEHFIFAISGTEQMLACRGQPGRYELSAPVIGVRTPDAPCDEEGLAQSPDGSPLMCLDVSGQRMWRVYLDF